MKQSKLRHAVMIASALFASTALYATVANAASDDSQPKTVHLRGVITGTSDSGFSIKTDEGQMRKIALSDSTKIAGVVDSSLDEVKEGTFIGTANVDDGSGHKALEVVVFPDSMKGTGLGDYSWDLSPSEVKGSGSSDMSKSDGSSMTNGTVEKSDSGSSDNMSSSFSMSGSTMTNGTVTKANDGSKMSVKVDYGDGSKMISIPKDVPVVALEKGSKSDIKSGEHVFIAGPQGSNPFEAAMVLVGKNGTVPPM